MITSAANAKVRQVIQWQSKVRERRRDGVYVAEGFRMYEEAPEEMILEVYLSRTVAEEIQAGNAPGQGHPSHNGEDARGAREPLGEKLRRTGCETVSDELFRKMSDTQTPQGILTVLRQPAYDPEELLSRPNPLLVLLEDLQDPGNLGTILRTGEGAGITGVIMNGGTVDPFNPKTIRATMGSVYRVPFVCVTELAEIFPGLRAHGIHTYAAHLEGQVYYDAFSFREPTAFLIGNEGRGLRPETARLAGDALKIPMEGRVESLNAAVAASLLMYEAHRQRRGLFN